MNKSLLPLMLVFLIVIVQAGTPHMSNQRGTVTPDANSEAQTTGKQPGLGRILWWRTQRLWNRSIREQAELARQQAPAPEVVNLQPLAETEAELIWLGHATVMVRYGDTTILTDPLLSDQASPVSWAGPERIVAPAMSATELPFIDMVLISHNHYDHLDLPTLRDISHRTDNGGRHTLFLVPENLAGWMRKKGFDNVQELAWWESRTFAGWSVTATPSQHHSGRNMFDKDKSRWSGWALKRDNFSFFFAGDTGYSDVYQTIGERLGPFTLAAIPIGGYAPRKLMQYAHVTPEEAVNIHQQINAKKSIGIHWGTFLGLTDEPFFEPPKRLQAAVEWAGLQADAFSAIDIGGSVIVSVGQIESLACRE